MTSSWSDPYHGVTHLLDAPQGFQYTVCDYGAIITACEIPLNDSSFTKSKEEVFNNIASAMQWCEIKAAARKT